METEEDDQDYSPASSVSEDAIDGLESEDYDSQDDAAGDERGPVDEDGNDNEGNGSDAGELSDPERERERERAGMPRHVQRALWRILVGDPARLGPEPSTHDELIDSLKRARILLDQRVSRAMELIPRGNFVPQEQQGEAYLDCPLAVPQLGFNISAPHIHATCLERLELEPGHHFLDVGSGCGLVTCLVESHAQMGQYRALHALTAAPKLTFATAEEKDILGFAWPAAVYTHTPSDLDRHLHHVVGTIRATISNMFEFGWY